MPIRVKICCIQSVEEMGVAVRCGAAAVGLVSAMPSGPGPIPESRIAEIADRVPPGVTSVLLTSRTDPEAICEQQRRCGIRAVQLCDRVSASAHRLLRRALPGVALVQVVHVRGEQAGTEALAAAENVHAVLLDSGNPDAASRELGGTGRVHDWGISRRIVERCPVPVFLAGGLSPRNVAEAVRMVCPWGVDVCSGVRTDGALDEGRVKDFLAAAAAGVRGDARGHS